MTIEEICSRTGFSLVCGDPAGQVDSVYCGDLLSRVMGKAPAGCAWVTVMGNVNAVAVASLCETGLMVIAEGARPDETAVDSAREHGIAIALSPEPIYETAQAIGGLL